MLSASKTGNPINIEKSKIAAATHDQNLFVNSSPSSSVTSSSNGIPIVINPATDETKTESDDNLISIQEQQHQPQNSSQPHLTSYAMPENEFPFEYAFKTMVRKM